MPLFEVIGSPPDIPPERLISMEDVRKLHDTTFRFECTLGTMLLRRITQNDLEKTTIRLMREHPDYEKAAMTVNMLIMLGKGGVSLTAEQMIELQKAQEIVAPYDQDYRACCFTEPKVKDGKDLSDLLFEMIPTERAELLNALQMLTNPAPDGKLRTTAFTLYKMFGIKIFEDMTFEETPAIVAKALLDVVEEANKKAQNG